MKLLVLPPHRDVTLAPEAPEGWRVVDVARDFCRRVFAPDAVEAEAEARARGPVTAQAMRELLLLRTARELRQRGGEEGHAALRALGAVLTALSGPPHGVHLRLDDVELEGGTTERSEDVLRVLGMPTAYQEDLARAVESFASAERVRLWLERDLQLPAAAWLARACPGEVPLEIAGPFARTHREVLARMPMFQRATFPEDAEAPRWRVVPLMAEPGPESPLWIPEGMHVTPTGGAAWAGHVKLEALLGAESLVESGCRVAVVGFCAVRDGFVLDPYGNALPLGPVRRGMERLHEAGVRVLAEWWVGAPGVDEAALAETQSALEAQPLFDWVTGVRPFHWSIERGPEPRVFGQAGLVRPQNPPADRDLARSRLFEAPGTLPAENLTHVMTAQATRLLKRTPLGPGRVAATVLTVPRAGPDTVPPTHLRLDPDCALVQLPATLDGTPRPTWYAANLRTGTVLAMDARLAPRLAVQVEPAQAAEVLGAVPEAQRAKLVEALVSKSVLERVHL